MSLIKSNLLQMKELKYLIPNFNYILRTATVVFMLLKKGNINKMPYQLAGTN